MTLGVRCLCAVEGCPMHCMMYSGIPGLHPTPTPLWKPEMSSNIAKCPLGCKMPLVENSTLDSHPHPRACSLRSWQMWGLTLYLLSLFLPWHPPLGAPALFYWVTCIQIQKCLEVLLAFLRNAKLNFMENLNFQWGFGYHHHCHCHLLYFTLWGSVTRHDCLFYYICVMWTCQSGHHRIL